MTTETCPLCRNANTVFKYKLHSDASILECTRCNFSFRKERDLLEWEQKTLDLGFHYNLDLEEYDRTHAKTFYNYLSRCGSTKGKSILDIGCARGSLLKVAEQAGFSRLLGIEISESYAKEIMKRNSKITIFTKPISEVALKQESIDCITAIDVLEHLYNPMDDLKSIYRTLKKDGCFIAVTGNIDSTVAAKQSGNWEYYYTPGHINFFTPEGIKKHFKKIGFRKVVIQCSLDDITKKYSDEVRKEDFLRLYQSAAKTPPDTTNYFNEYEFKIRPRHHIETSAKVAVHSLLRLLLPKKYYAGNGMLIKAVK